MKFCEKCGTQLADEIFVCPQCQHQMKQQFSPKKKINKMILIIPLIVIITVVATFTCAYFVLPMNPRTESSSKKDSNNGKTSTKETTTTNSDNVCPADEYGNHDWQSATCQHPSYCFECGAYKDDKLGYHDFELDEETGLIRCWRCNLLKSEYDSE